MSATPGAPFEQRLWTTLNSPSVEAITEFAVDTNGFKAEFGHAGGGGVSFVSRSGTNSWQGKVFEFFRHDALDTIDYFSKALGRPKPPLEQHDFGGVFGGPVMLPGMYNGRNKTFFFASYEAYRNKSAAAPRTATIPTAAMFAGDFSEWRDANGNLIPIYDPATTRVNPNGLGFIRDPFPGNMIPAERFSQISREVLQSGDHAAGPAGRAQQFRLHARATPSARTRGTSSASSSITTSRARIGSGFSSTGARCS